MAATAPVARRRPVFGTALDYHELNAGAHRKPPKVLSAPSLVRHLAFWTNSSAPDANGKALPRRSAAIVKDEVDALIVRLYRAIETIDPQVALEPPISGYCLLFNSFCQDGSLRPLYGPLTKRQFDIFTSVSRSIPLQFKWANLDVTIRFEIHTEYLSIATFVELDRNRTKARDNVAWSELGELNACIARILAYLHHPASPQGGPGDDGVPRQINQYCFHDFWAAYDTAIFAPHLGESPLFAEVFADFRGFIASDQAIAFDDAPFFTTNAPPQWGHQAKAKFLPLIQHRDRTRQTRYECAVNYMLSGRAFYMSTLGPQLPSMPPDERIPVEFIVYAHQRRDNATVVNKWQLGRMVNQILLLGTLRLCALRDLKLLHDAGRQLRELDEGAQKAREAIARLEAKSGRGTGRDGTASDDPDPAPPAADSDDAYDDEKVMKLIAAAHQKLNSITRVFLDESGSGLQYRIERSRYYVKQFEDNVGLLRIGRIEGDQPYDQFIRRRLGSEFDFIDRLGIRFERATRNMVTLDQNYLAVKANAIDEDIHKIQTWGEFALLGALVPYYVSHLLVPIVGEEWPHVPLMTINVWLIGLAVAVGRFTKVLKLSTAISFVIGVALLLLALVPLEIALLGQLHHTTPEDTRAAQTKTLIDLQKDILASQRALERLASEAIRLQRPPEPAPRSVPPAEPETGPSPGSPGR